MSDKVKLQDIADRAGVCRATVSLALRQHASIPAVTRDRIRQIADELGYRPNPLVSALMRHQRASRAHPPLPLTLALVIKFAKADAWQQYLSPELISGATRRAAQLGYRLEEFWLNDLGWSETRLSTVLFNRNIPGVIVAPLPNPDGTLNLEWSRFSAVAIGYSLVQPQLHSVTSDRYQALLLAVRQLRDRGHGRIGLALDANQDARVNHQWVAAYLWEQSQTRPKDRLAPLVAGDGQWGEQRFAAWFRKYRPEVVLGHDPRMLGWLKKLNRSVGAEAGFAHLWNPDKTGQFTGLYHNPPEIGVAAVDYVVSLIQRNERGVPSSAHCLQLEASWVEGGTVGTTKRG